VPLKLARDPDAPSGMTVAGYFMHFLKGAEQLAHYKKRDFLNGLGIEHVDILNWTILPVFRDLHNTVTELHRHKPQVLIGDFSDTNVLVKGSSAYLCDADSFGFGKYPARMGKPEFSDPLLSKKGPSPDTDWYAYTVLLVQSLLGVMPYGGRYFLPGKKMPMPLEKRIRQRISVFHEGVKPTEFATKWTISPTMLPDNLIEHFKAVFGHKDKRGIFPAQLLDMRWSRCVKCQAVHARTKCPACGTEIAEAQEETQELSMQKTCSKGSSILWG
jgi:hypothetical protein